MINEVGQKAAIVAHAQQRGMAQRSTQAANGLITVFSMDDNFRNHGVIERRNRIALRNAVVNANTVSQISLRLPPQHLTRLRREPRIRVFGIQTCFDRVAVERDISLRRWQGLARSHAQLPLNQIKAGDHFRHRMLDLQPRVHFKEVMFEVCIDDELNRTSALVTYRQGSGHRVAAHGFAHRRADNGRWRFFNYFLAPALGSAIALTQMNCIASRVCKHLNFDMTSVVDQTLQHQGAITECALRLPPGPDERLGHFARFAHQAHAASATARHSLYQQRESELVGLTDQVLVVLILAKIPWCTRHSSCDHAPLGQRLVTHGVNGRRRRADEDQPRVCAGLRKALVFAQKSVSRMHCISA